MIEGRGPYLPKIVLTKLSSLKFLHFLSMQGDRDSEIGVWMQDSQLMRGSMAGMSFQVGRFCHSLRMSLWKEHLGITDTDADLLHTICDPISDKARSLWDGTAANNTQLYESVFQFIPQNDIKNLSQVNERKKKFASGIRDRETRREKAELLAGVKGHLVDYPYHFFEDEHLTITLLQDPLYVPFKQSFW